MAFRAVVADRLALALLATQQIDERLTEQETEYQRGEEGTTRPECNVLEQGEEAPGVRRKFGQLE